MATDPSRNHPRDPRRPIGSRATARRVRRRSTARSPGATRQRRGDVEVSSVQLLVARLRMIFGTAVTAELALRAQGAERDVEIADCLRGGVSGPLADQIERFGVRTERERHSAVDSRLRGESRRIPTRRTRMTRKGRPLQ